METKGQFQSETSSLCIEDRLLDRYLAILGCPRKEPDYGYLTQLVKAHLLQIPFENVSKLYYRKHLGLRSIPDLELFLDGIERYHFGGTCYSNNYHFYQLLAGLGFSVVLCGADMSKPDVHIVSMVTVQQHEYLVDAGYAAPFWMPLPRDLVTDYEVVLGRDRYLLKPQDANGCSRMELYRDGRLKHGYLAKPEPRQIGDFEHVVLDSFRGSATFMNALLLACFSPDRSVVIHNLTVLESQGTVSRLRSLAGEDDLAKAVREFFGIPAEFTLEAAGELEQFEDAWR